MLACVSVLTLGCASSGRVAGRLSEDPVVAGYRAAGLEHRTPYALRHTFATFAIAAGIPTFEIARMMGSSVVQIEETYGHLLPDALDRGRHALDAFDQKHDEAYRRRMGADD